MDVPLPPDEPVEPAEATKGRLSRRILSGGAWAIAGRAGSMGALFLLNVLLARTSQRSYSAFLTASSAVAFLSMLATLGVPYTLVRLVRGASVTTRERAAMLRGALTLTLWGSAATGAAYWLATPLFSAAAKWDVLRDHPALTIGWFALSALCVVCACYLQAEDDFRTAALVGARSGGLLTNGGTAVGVLAAAWGGWLTLHGVLSLQVTFFAAALVLAAAVIGRRLAHDLTAAPPAATSDGPSYSAWWYFVDCWPNLVNQLIGVVLVEVDLFWVACLADETAVAQYGVVRNLRLLVTAPLLVASISLPAFVAELYSRGDLVRLERLLRASASAVAAPALAVLVVLALAPATAIEWVYGPAYLDAARALQITAVGAIVFVLSGSNAMTLTMTGRHRELMTVSLASLVLYVAASVPLVRAYGVTGAAAAYALQTIVQNIAVTWRVKRTVGVWTVPYGSWSTARAELAQLRRTLRPGRK